MLEKIYGERLDSVLNLTTWSCDKRSGGESTFLRYGGQPGVVADIGSKGALMRG